MCISFEYTTMAWLMKPQAILNIKCFSLPTYFCLFFLNFIITLILLSVMHLVMFQLFLTCSPGMGSLIISLTNPSASRFVLPSPGGPGDPRSPLGP